MRGWAYTLEVRLFWPSPTGEEADRNVQFLPSPWTVGASISPAQALSADADAGFEVEELGDVQHERPMSPPFPLRGEESSLSCGVDCNFDAEEEASRFLFSSAGSAASAAVPRSSSSILRSVADSLRQEEDEQPLIVARADSAQDESD